MCLGVPGEVLEIRGAETEFPEGTVRFGGVSRVVSLACVPSVRVGEYVLVHAGLAIAVVDPVEAQRLLQLSEPNDRADAFPMDAQP